MSIDATEAARDHADRMDIDRDAQADQRAELGEQPVIVAGENVPPEAVAAALQREAERINENRERRIAASLHAWANQDRVLR